MHAMKVGFIAALMVTALTGSALASTPVSVITDAAGDANALANDPGPVTLDATTPASDAAMDITDVSLWRDHTALNIRFGLAGAPDPSTPNGLYTLTSASGGCPVRFFVATGGPGSPSLTGGIEWRRCGGLFFGDGVTATADGSAIVLRVPFADLARVSRASQPGEILGGLTAQTRIASYSVSSEPQVDALLLDPIGPLIDATGTGSDYTIPEDDPSG